jgi:hypothetical protein
MTSKQLALSLVFGAMLLGSSSLFAQPAPPPASVPPPVTDAQSVQAAPPQPAFFPPPSAAAPVSARTIGAERDASGRLVVRAVKLSSPLVLDGRLEDEVYHRVPSIGGFIQQEPNEGQPATEWTEAWIFYDERNVYVSARMYLSEPDRLRANEMRRDSVNIFRNDFFSVTLDTLHDKRSGSFVMTNALGGMRDALITDETRSTNFDFNMVWQVKSQRFEGGWTTEIAVPFRSLRYTQKPEQTWGIILARGDWWKNEFSYLVPIPRAAGLQGSFRVSDAATLVGIEAPPPGLNLEVKPFVTGNSTTAPVAPSSVPGAVPSPGFSTALGQEYGIDVKYNVTRSLAADFTYNTDFAQVEVDDQQINLTRFNLFYPEKREFFLEGQGLFAFGGASSNAFGSNNTGAAANQTPILFFSRNIGLNNGEPVPIQAGGRLMGKVGAYNVGALRIGTDAVGSVGIPSTQFTVVRVKRDILRRSSIGVIATERAPSGGSTPNRVVGADVTFAFFKNLEALSYYARSRTAGRTGDEESFRGRLFYNGDKFGLDVDHLKVGADFNPEVGFMARRGFRRQFLLARYSPRPKIRGVRRLFIDTSLDNFDTAATGELQTRTASGTFRVDFNSGDIVTANVGRFEDHPESAFRLAGGITVLPGVYNYDQGTLSWQLGSQRKVTGTISANTGEYYGGTQHGVSYNGRVEITKQLAVEPRVGLTWLDFPQGRVLTQLFSTRTTFAMTPRMFVAAFLQYNSAANVVGLNTRFRWEYIPGSDFFLVYSEGRNTAVPGFPELSNRQLAAKFTRFFRF